MWHILVFLIRHIFFFIYLGFFLFGRSVLISKYKRGFYEKDCNEDSWDKNKIRNGSGKFPHCVATKSYLKVKVGSLKNTSFSRKRNIMVALKISSKFSLRDFYSPLFVSLDILDKFVRAISVK